MAMLNKQVVKVCKRSATVINTISSRREFQYHQIGEKTLVGISRGKLNGKYKSR